MLKLSDISVKYGDGHSDTLQFHFEKNEYFTNSVLTKQYVLKSTVDPDDPFAFEGPKTYKGTGFHHQLGEDEPDGVDHQEESLFSIRFQPTPSISSTFYLPFMGCNLELTIWHPKSQTPIPPYPHSPYRICSM